MAHELQRDVERLEAELAAARRRRDRAAAHEALRTSERRAAEVFDLAPSYVHRLVVASRAGALELEHEREAGKGAEVQAPALGVHVGADPEIPRLEPEPRPNAPAVPAPPSAPPPEPEPAPRAAEPELERQPGEFRASTPAEARWLEVMAERV